MRWLTRCYLAAPALLGVLACTLCISTYHIFGNFWDEPEHIAAGLVLIDRGEYLYDNQHPPLARLAAAIGPYLAGARFHGEPMPIGEAQGRDLLYNSPASYDTILTLARLGMLPFLLLLLAASWLWVRRWYGAPAALMTLVFLVSTPVILGHAAVVALDVPVTAMTILTLYLLLRWFESPGIASGLRLGLAAGLAIATKMSAVPFIGVAALSLIALRLLFVRRAPLRWMLPRRLGSAALALLLTAVVMVGIYGPKLVYLTTPDLAPSPALDFLSGHHGVLHDLAYRFAARVRLPLGVLMVPTNFLGVEWHNEHGHLSFLLGRTDLDGWWYFYLVALAVKTPLPLLLLGVTGLGLLALRGWREHDVYLMAPAACFVSILVFCCVYSHINIGVRHVLIAYPLLAIGAGYAVCSTWAHWRALLARGAIAGLVAWQVAILAIAYPDYLAYFNPLAGDHPERILVDSDLDWGGQDLRRLEQVLAARGVQQFWLGYKGTADLSREALPPYTLLKANQPVSGWVAITMLTLQQNQAGYAWLKHYQPVQRVGKSIELYYIP
ncbi:MAG TPA: phospholipid carrier-dependent glycosyltransferase [Steroidobacteraceae bacterium]|nr:phospholipid carrier-dependent glycosyltransferase [Steroidobacteraceae bacterium]